MLHIGPPGPPVDESQHYVGEGESAEIGEVIELHGYPAQKDVEHQQQRVDAVGVYRGGVCAGGIADLLGGGVRSIGGRYGACH